MVVIKVLSLIFLLTGMVLLGAALFVYQDTRDFLRRAQSGEGTITEVTRRAVRHRFTGTVYDYTVRYGAAQGDNGVSFVSRGHNAPDYTVGQVVPILYAMDSPRRAAIDGFTVLWSSFGLLAIAGGCLASCGACNLWITATPARAKMRTAVTLQELHKAFRAGRLTRASEYQGLLVAFTFVGFALGGTALAIVVFASSTLKLLLAIFALYMAFQMVRAGRARQRGLRT